MIGDTSELTEVTQLCTAVLLCKVNYKGVSIEINLEIHLNNSFK